MSIKKCVNGSFVNDYYREYGTETDTITTLPKSIIADGQSASADIIGNMVQTGTPSPSSIIMPDECGDKTANLLDVEFTNGYYLSSSTGLPSAYTGFCSILTPINVENISTVTFSYTTERNVQWMYSKFNGSTLIQRVSGMNNGDSINVADCDSIYLCFYVSQSTITVNEVANKMLNKGSTALPYEPHGIKIPISSGGTTTNVYLGEVQTTRKIRKYEFTGNEEFTKNNTSSTNYLYYRGIATLAGIMSRSPVLCSHLPIVASAPQNVIGCNTDNSFSVIYFNFGADIMNAQPSGNTPSGMSEYLSAQYANGTPVTVWYVLAEPTTGIVNEPIRKIGNYADSVSVSNIHTTGTAEQFDVDTTLKPSEVQLTYHGWHEHSDEKYVGGVVNKFNKDATDTNNGYLNNTFLRDDNTTSVSSAWAVSEYIDISGISTLSAKNANTSSTITAICYYNDSKTFISGTAYNGTNTQTFTVPSNAKYCRMSYVKPASVTMLVEGSTVPSTYHPYYEWVTG